MSYSRKLFNCNLPVDVAAAAIQTYLLVVTSSGTVRLSILLLIFCLCWRYCTSGPSVGRCSRFNPAS